jgi:methylisocitrate lyase
MGYRIAVFPLSGLYGAAYAMRKIFSDLKQTGSTQSCRDIMMNFGEFNELIELQKFMDMDHKYSNQAF